MEPNEERAIDRRKRRRRKFTRMPVSAKLTIDDRVKSSFGIVSQGLFHLLFGRTHHGDHEAVHYIAIAPWQPPSLSLEKDCTWTILPVTVQEASASPSSICCSPTSLALQRFVSTLRSAKNGIKIEGALEVVVLDVQPLPLETVFVRVDGEALRKHQDVQRKFGGGFSAQHQNGNSSRGRDKALSTERSMEERLRTAIRSSLAELKVVHRTDLLPLPLPAHPITHVAFQPMEVMACEPVDQGLVTGQTKIVIDMDTRNRSKTHRTSSYITVQPNQRMAADGGDEDVAAAEQFYSAAENGYESCRRGLDSPDDEESTSDDLTSDEGNLSDDSVDNTIALTSPTLPMHSSGVLSSIAAATPRPFGARTNGTHTPGSVYSNFTASTARQDGLAGRKSFRARPLVAKVSDSVLHPTPAPDEDDEARVFVDVKMLVRLGCFSGDWVRLSVDLQPNDKDGLWPLGAFGDDESVVSFRVVKIYGLPDASKADMLRDLKRMSCRPDSDNSAMPASRRIPSAYLSPILYANIGRPNTISLSPLAATEQIGKGFLRSKIAPTNIPPIAKDVTLLRLPTPLSTERAVQPGLLANLKRYFENRRRILYKGDLIGISINVGASRILSDIIPGTEAEHDLEELLAASPPEQEIGEETTGVAWFRIGEISRPILDDEQQGQRPEIWGELATIEPLVTRIAQSGSEQGSLPSVREVPWDYYLGTRRCPDDPSAVPAPLKTLDEISGTFVPPLRRRLRELLATTTSSQAVYYDMKPIVILLHSTQRSVGKATLASMACADLGLHIFSIDAYDMLSEGGAGGGDVKSEASLRAKVERSLTCGAEYTVPLIRHAEALVAERIATALADMLRDLRALVMTTTEIEKIPESVRSLFTHEFEVSAPDEKEREDILGSIICEKGLKIAHDVELGAIAVKTAALVAGDLVDVVERAQVARQERIEQLLRADDDGPGTNATLIRDVLVSGGSGVRSLIKADFDIAVDAARKNFADSIGAPKIPNVTWDDVGGLTNVKDAVMETIQLPLERPELFAKGMKKRSGILFYGPPGTGKTLLAKAIATEFSLNFFSVKGPELLNMYIGESEANVRRVFQRARDARPCVVFFDELDSVAPKRGNQGDSGGVMDRIVSQLLAELDGMSGGDGGGGGVFVIGATNRPDLLDQALLRPGRFDKMLYLGVSDTHDKQLTILEALTRKFTLHPQTSLRRVAEGLPFTYTGADLYALCSDAMLKAITRQAVAVDAKIKALPRGPTTTAYFFDHLATDEDTAVMVTEEDFVAAQQELVGSVSAKELEHYHRVRQTFEAPDAKQQSGMNMPHASTSSAHLSLPRKQMLRPKPRDADKRAAAAGKGKGKLVHQDIDNIDEDEDDDDAYVTSNDYAPPYRTAKGNQSVDGFGDAAGDDDESLYG